MHKMVEQYIKRSGKNKTEIAKEVGVSASSFYEKLNGKSEINLPLAKKIKRALGAVEPLEVLFDASGGNQGGAA